MLKIPYCTCVTHNFFGHLRDISHTACVCFHAFAHPLLSSPDQLKRCHGCPMKEVQDSMENIYSSPRFTSQPREGAPESCGVQVFSDPERHQVTVVFHARNHRTLRTEPHRLVNAFYREVLFRLLSPASSIKWCLCQDGHTHQTIQLAGLPGGYTRGQVAYSLTLATPNRARVATG